MGKSLIPGIYGYAKGKVGAVVYSTSTAALDGQRRQIIRLKPESVRNPNTVAQIVQRMKIGPAHLFYAAFAKAGGSEENNPLSHSFEGYQYGAKNRTRFMQLAMTGDPKAYVPKGINFPVPGVYQVSEGSLPNLPEGVDDATGDVMCVVGTDLTSTHIQTLQAAGVEVGDQITVLALVDKDGVYAARVARIIVAEGNYWQYLTNNDDGEGLILRTSGINFEDATETTACAAFILSRGTSSSNALRSTQIMTLNDAYASLMSPEAYDAAVDSYLTGTIYNSLNSTWYLNQGNSQAFNGEVFKQFLTLAAGDGVAEVSGEFLLGRQLNGSAITYVIFTSDGTSSGTAYMNTSEGFATAAAYTAARVATALGSVNIAYAQYSDAVVAQMSGNV